ncbi:MULTISPECIES: DUF6615 family protein [unclassified Nocardia]|uniref:DUF6615 family protein n=1 Tax=Nocardia sp. NPDC019255 TaxID=3154591 RepID=UPI0033EE9775
MNLVDLCSAMNWLAVRTWQDYADSSRYRLSLDEETTTDRNLLELRRLFPDLHVHKYTRQREHTVGADWEWWIGSDSEGWLCLRIQAKRVFATTYKQLDHPGAKRGVHQGKYQYDTLISSCRMAGYIFPFHVFYNGWEASRFARRSGTRLDLAALELNDFWPRYGPRYGARAWGCAALSTYRVASLHSVGGPTRSSVPRYLEHSVPWSELFTIASAPDSQDHRTELDLLQESLTTATTHATAPMSGGETELAAHPERRRERLPEYVQIILAGRSDGADIGMFRDYGFLPAKRVVVVPLDHNTARNQD